MKTVKFKDGSEQHFPEPGDEEYERLDSKTREALKSAHKEAKVRAAKEPAPKKEKK